MAVSHETRHRRAEEAVRTALYTAIQRWRRQTGLGYRELALELGVSEPTIYYWLKRDNGARVTVSMVVRLCDALGLDMLAVLADALIAHRPIRRSS